MTLDEYKSRMSAELEKLDWHNPGDKESGAYKLLSRAATDRDLQLNEWMELHEMYWKGVKKQ